MKVLATMLLLAATAARPPAKAPPAPARPAPAKPSPDTPTARLLEQARAHFQALEYAQLLPLVEELVTRPDATTAMKSEAYLLQSSAIVVERDPLDAERPFRLLLRLEPGFDLPADTAPKILAVFRKVQAEEAALNREAKAQQRSALIAGLKLLGEPPRAGRGGRPLAFTFRLRDLTSAVEAIRVPYRKGGADAFSSLALHRDEEGLWSGALPGELTANEAGFPLEYFIETSDSEGPLLMLGSAKQPLVALVSPGAVRGKPPPLPRWAFYLSAAGTVAAGATAGTFGWMARSGQAEYRRIAAEDDIDGAALMAKGRYTQDTARNANVAAVGAGALLVTSVIIALFVDWAGEDAPGATP